MLNRLAIVIWYTGTTILLTSIGLSSFLMYDYIRNESEYQKCINKIKISNGTQNPQPTQPISKDPLLSGLEIQQDVQSETNCYSPELNGVLFVLAVGIIMFLTTSSLSFVFGNSFWRPPKKNT